MANCSNEYLVGWVIVYVHTFLDYDIIQQHVFAPDVIHINLKIQNFDFYLLAIYRPDLHRTDKGIFLKQNGQFSYMITLG